MISIEAPLVSKLTAAALSLGLMLSLWAPAASAAWGNGGARSCANGAMVETRAHASGETTFRHHRNESYRGIDVNLGDGGYHVYRSGYTSVYRASMPSMAWFVYKDFDNEVWSARATCSPPA